MKKIFLIILAGIIGFYSFSFAWNEFTYENAKKIANEYIKNSSFDENWQDQNPTLFWEGKYFYTESETPSYIEFKVSCDKNPDCGFIMVNFDGDDVAIPIASTSGNTPSEVLSAKNESKIEENMLYYFSPFEQYAENKRNGNISSIDPQDDFWYEASEKNKLSLQEVKTKKNNTLKEKIESSKKEAKTFKKSVEFKEIKKELKEKKQTNGKEEVSFKYLDMAMAWYNAPATSNYFITWSTYSGCNWKLPCYQQFNTTYNWVTCAVWCVPVAYSMIYWYYDRNLTYPDLLSWTTAPTWNNTDVMNNMMKILWTNYLSTTCSWAIGNTKLHNAWNWIQFAIDKWYSKSTSLTASWTTTSNLFHNNIKPEINAWRPIIVNTTTHSFVAFWYYNTTLVNTKIIRVNLWFWPSYPITSDSWTMYYGSNIDYNIDSIFFPNVNQWAIHSVIKVIISK